jgi:hypothetical protein
LFRRNVYDWTVQDCRMMYRRRSFIGGGAASHCSPSDSIHRGNKGASGFSSELKAGLLAVQKAKPEHASSEQNRDFPLLDSGDWDHDPVRRCRHLCNSPSSLEHSLDTGSSQPRRQRCAHPKKLWRRCTQDEDRRETADRTRRSSSRIRGRQTDAQCALNVTTTACRGRWPGFQPPLSFSGHVQSE